MNFVCIVFELGDKMLTLSSMENLIVPCNLKAIRISPTGFDTTLLIGWFYRRRIATSE